MCACACACLLLAFLCVCASAYLRTDMYGGAWIDVYAGAGTGNGLFVSKPVCV